MKNSIPIIDGPDTRTNFNGMTKKEIIYDLVKHGRNLYDARSIYTEMLSSGLIKETKEIGYQATLESSNNKSIYSNALNTLEEIDKAILDLKSDPQTGINKYDNMSKDEIVGTLKTIVYRNSQHLSQTMLDKHTKEKTLFV